MDGSKTDRDPNRFPVSKEEGRGGEEEVEGEGVGAEVTQASVNLSRVC